MLVTFLIMEKYKSIVTNSILYMFLKTDQIIIKCFYPNKNNDKMKLESPPQYPSIIWNEGLSKTYPCKFLP